MGEVGDNVGLLLRGVRREAVVRGQVVAVRGTATAHSSFEGLVYFLPDAGRLTRAEFYFRTIDVLGAMTFPAVGSTSETTAVAVGLSQPVAMDEGLTFAVRHEGRTVGFGLVTRVHQATGSASTP